MEIWKLLTLQLMAHCLTDYIFQSHDRAKEKNENGFRSSFLKWHGLIAFVSAWMLSFEMAFLFGALIIGMTHYLIDGLKMYLNRNKIWNTYAFFIDQFLHLLVITLVVVDYAHLEASPGSLVSPIPIKYLVTILAYLACSKPANILIKQLFSFFDIKINMLDELPNAGKLIGTFERWLILTFIIAHHFEAVGFLIAAKSILRFKNDDSIRSEYVLIGTMLSFGIALFFGILINKI